jgi:hypothetical protein
MNSQIQMDELLGQIRNQVELRRASGLYPPGLEQQLEREFAEIMSSTNRRYFASKDLTTQITHLESALERLSGRTPSRSRVPGLSLVHRVVEKLTKRQVLGLTAQVRDVESLVIVVLKMLGEFAESQETADSRVVRELSQHVLDRVSVVDHLAILTTELEARIRKLELHAGQ